MGGAGADVLAYAVVMEELSRGYASVADQVGLVELLATLLSEHGTRGAARAILRAAAALREKLRLCADRGGGGLGPRQPEDDRARDGDGWRLDGAKLWIHNAPVADFAAVLARTDPAAGHRGMSIFLVDLDAPGVERPQGAQDGPARLAGRRAALRQGAPAREAMLGPEGRGFHMMMSVLDKGRVGIAALALGILQRALEEA
jgi:alkylation response protein AidB-like acyl-CoA dehydrogenase